MQAMLMSKQVNHVNSGPEILHGLPPGTYNFLYTMQELLIKHGNKSRNGLTSLHGNLSSTE